MPASNSTRALRHALAKVFCAIGASADNYTAMRERTDATARENFSSAAIAGTANDIPAVSPLNLTINNNPPQQWEVQPIADKLDQLINTLLRP